MKVAKGTLREPAFVMGGKADDGDLRANVAAVLQ